MKKKVCDTSICKPLELIFRSCLENGKFPAGWKKANVFPAHKKGDKQNLKNYRPISLLPVAGKIFERILYNKMLEFFTEIISVSPNQSGFKLADLCINRLLSITHEIFKSLDDIIEIQGIFLKAFDKVWHKGLLYKLKKNGVSGNLFDIITNCLNFRKQRVVSNGQYSSWTSIEAGLPQGSILGLLLFLIYIHDLFFDLTTNVKFFADDTSLFSIVHNRNTSTFNLNNDLNKIKNWAIR